jgi:hypothetical protein
LRKPVMIEQYSTRQRKLMLLRLLLLVILDNGRF